MRRENSGQEATSLNNQITLPYDVLGAKKSPTLSGVFEWTIPRSETDILD